MEKVIPFINENLLFKIIEETSNPSSERVDEILQKSLELNGLTLEEASILLNTNNPEDVEKIFFTAGKIKDEIYGNRLVLFAPLYISNYCSNNCLYCGFRIDNKSIERKVLSLDEIKEETKIILEQGHKRILLLMGEDHEKCSLDYFIQAIYSIYSVRDSKGSSIRRINVEIAPLSENEFRVLSEVPIGTYTVFQETYHKETYERMHPKGKKHNYIWRLFTMDRALSNGMHDVGIGALFGLFDFRFETLALIQHSKHLDQTYGIGPHTISIPRVKPAKNAPASYNSKYSVNDNDFKKLVAVLRISVPYTGIILSTREPAYLRNELFNLGVSQISAGSKTSVGGYKQAFNGMEKDEEIGQFTLNDCRSSGEVIKDLIKMGFVPSFCTACYRLGRVGEDFMDLAKPGLIKTHCHPNGLTTLKEYLVDYADSETKLFGEKLIENELNKIEHKKLKQKTIEYLKRIEKGERDLYF
ncbi:MAG: [FeFe] hydrogenase H-cluster radical SAM maturase HydG [Ignavibacteria bacterium]|nr:[FeFe] hydrogenase H-cluster radical SAM maturase HydG [Ignavibacteria bacterium]